ncbi:MAG TPA: hypothetical protein VJ912_02500 [Candidatus Nanoarchaeia archaeon]|nr:hypothetical protein [Candidatus Nanoarchaeia archaeon]
MEQKPKIAISQETKDRLDNRGRKIDTYDDIIKEILDKLEKKEKKYLLGE